MVQNILNTLGNYFLFPEGAIALTGLLPLLIFYLVRKKPEQQVMPSYMFFTENRESDSATQALNTLLRNLILLFHIFLVVGFAAAITNPFINTGTPDHSVLVLDQSASMEGDFERAKNFLKDNIGEKNTLILVSDESRTVAEQVSGSRARKLMEKARLQHTSTDIKSGLEKAQGEGEVFVASDMDQSVDSSSVDQVLERYRSNGYSYSIMETERRNSWGVIDLDVQRSKAEVDVKNFLDSDQTVSYRFNGDQREVSIPGESVETIELEPETGRNTVELEQDRFGIDNTARFYLPEEKKFDVLLISDDGNRYLETVFELVNFTSIQTTNPPLDSVPEADLYIVGETDRVLSSTIEAVEQRTRSGKDLILFGNQEFSDMGFDDLPVEDRADYRNLSVTVREPVRVNLGETEARNVKKIRGESLTNRKNVVIRASYGQGEILFYNINDRKFRTRFLYPVFWKEITSEMLERPEIEELNLRTGDEVNRTGLERNGESVNQIKQEGFYDYAGGTIAANLLNEDESLRDEIEIENQNQAGGGESKKSVQHLASVLLLLLVLGELAYLYRIGDLR